ncbi:unnamed protein product [Didymodactylos carnosus]|uniref:Integrase catalytic domain-containing protein n=1 Tax=Didymodactylos carnosus TaxID=1234261 RepID=A0A815HBK0_9BILA|nr:unnamed protein product [Didymodactylos carnosus]CAF1348736.1 unnamed protein product [Didymodactylos carnosus]CAF3988893.1 unnamed protein product [Didymodactylos carnosus]CAF4216771.1 unnamed protein product [Didymodactylos carnosus]
MAIDTPKLVTTKFGFAYNTIKQYLISCSKYQQFKISLAKPADTSEPIEVSTGVLDLTGLDFLDPVSQSTSDNKWYGSNHIKTTTYHPQTNGLTERFNATLAGSIGTYVNQQQTDWDEYLPFVTFAYNTSKQTTTQLKPFKLMFDRDPILPFKIITQMIH